MPAKKQPGRKQSEPNSKPSKDGLLDFLNPNAMLNNAQKVISSAVNVLEEEIAAGILAAKKIEKKVLDTEDADDNPENLINRIRRDSHDALDIFLDAFAALSKQMGILSDKMVQVSEKVGSKKESGQKSGKNFQQIMHDTPAKAGSKVALRLLLSDDEIAAPLPLTLQLTDFVGPGKQKIASRYVAVKPSEIVLNPGEELEISLEVSIPKTCKPSQFHALLTINEIPEGKVVLSLEIK